MDMLSKTINPKVLILELDIIKVKETFLLFTIMSENQLKNLW